MYLDSKIGVVVPAYNEESQIASVLETMPEYVDRIYVVDDASRDRTSEVVSSHLGRPGLEGRLELIRHPENRGVGAAISTGYEAAVIGAEVEVVAVMAGDGQMDPEDLPKLLGPLCRGQADYAKGNRLITQHSWKTIPPTRFFGNSVLSMLTKVASGYWHTADSQTGYTAITVDMLKKLPLDKLYPRYGYPNHLLVMLNILDARVREIPIKPVYNQGERSKMNIYKAIPTISWLLLKSFWWRMFHKYVLIDFHPLVFFYALSFLLVPLGFAFGAYLVLLRIILGSVAPTSALFATFLLISGFQFGLFAMWFDMERNRDLK
jgi:glycosyltransferase involved in cell wall biosynthesis